MKKLSLLLLFVLTSCATWNEDFEGKVVRAYPKASDLHMTVLPLDNYIMVVEV